jgi:polyphenol oxidase
VLHSSLLSELGWLTHGFGTRLDAISQDEMATLRQIHSGTVWTAEGVGLAGEGDALVTDRVGVPLSVRTADCYPILLADTRTHAFAAIHAGWRGTAARIVTNALATMRTQFGTEPADVRAAIGPGIGVCCYEVGVEVARQFGRSEAGKIDLAKANQRQLTDAGVEPQSIGILGGCTRCDAVNFHSFRRDKERAGRMISFIAIA